MSKYSHTSIEFFLGLSISDLYDWMNTVGDEIQRQNKEIEKAAKGGGGRG